MFQIAIVVTLAALAGAVSGGLTARWALRRAERRKGSTPPEPDAALAADFEQAAVAWSSSIGRPEAAGLFADKLHLIHNLGRRKGWWQ
jgi:hypothetical protein